MARMLPGRLLFSGELSHRHRTYGRNTLAAMTGFADGPCDPVGERQLAAAAAAGTVSLTLPLEGTSAAPLSQSPPLDRFAHRPPLEAAIAPMLAAASIRRLDPPAMIGAAQALTAGLATGIRPLALSSSPDGNGETHAFAAPADLLSEIAMLCELVNAPFDDNPLIEAIALHASALAVHPFIDGNGRFSRAMFHAVLAARGVAPMPIIPLGPALYSNSAAFVSHIRALRSTGDWEEFLWFMLRIINRILETMRAIPAAPSPVGNEPESTTG